MNPMLAKLGDFIFKSGTCRKGRPETAAPAVILR